MSDLTDIIVVGAGAAGLMAAISAARQHARVLILEHMDKPGRKLLLTGNGKCNYTNRAQGVCYFRGSDPAFVLPVFEQFSAADLIAFLQRLGLHPKSKREGYYYPASEQAAAVLEILLLELSRLEVTIAYQIGIRKIYKEGQHFIFDTKQGSYRSRACIIATGGKSYHKTGSDGSGLPYLLGFSHQVRALIPALVPLQAEGACFQELKGLRVYARAAAYIENQKVCEDTGEIQLLADGISGIPTFQISSVLSRALYEKKRCHVLLDFMPEETLKQLLALLRERFHLYGGQKTTAQALLGLFHIKLIPQLLKSCGVKPEQAAVACKKQQIEKLAFQIKHFKIKIVATKSFDAAQVTAGGVLTSELKNQTLESKLVKNLFLAGEVIDIDGMCGGYNLQWAFCSGYVAGRSAYRSIHDSDKTD